jgi:hypothetical protein
MAAAQWHPTQAAAAAISEYTLAWDTEKTDSATGARKIVKKYVACDSVADEWRFIEDSPAGGRHAYEVIREGAPVNPYFDIEWLEPTTEPSTEADAVDRVVMRTFIERVRMNAVMRHGLADPPQISVTTSTRFAKVSVREAKRYGMYATWILRQNAAAAAAGGSSGAGGSALQVPTNDDWQTTDGKLMMEGASSSARTTSS